MAQIVSTLDDIISYVNTMYNFSSTAPTSGDEDYSVWTSLANVAVNTWEYDNGILWNELFVKLADAADGDKTTTTGDYSYATPTNFRFNASGFVWLGDGTTKTPFKVIKATEVQLHENDMDNWCYFLMDATPTLEFNPNCIIPNGATINYNYYKRATKLTTGSSVPEMSDHMYIVYFILSELKKEEGNQSELQLVSQKLRGMEDANDMPTWYQNDQLQNAQDSGFGV